MPKPTLPYRPAGNAVRSIAGVLSDLDTINDYAEDLEDDITFATSGLADEILDRGAADTAEATTRGDADTALDARLDALEAISGTIYTEGQNAHGGTGDLIIPGIAITPEAGTYLAIATGTVKANDAAASGQYVIRIDGVTAISGAQVDVDTSLTAIAAVGQLTVDGTEEVTLFGNEVTAIAAWFNGDLTLVRIA